MIIMIIKIFIRIIIMQQKNKKKLQEINYAKYDQL